MAFRLWLAALSVMYFLFSHSAVSAEEQSKASVEALLGATSGNTAEIVVLFTIKDGWHIYAEDPGDTGIPTAFKFKNTEVKKHKIHWPKHHKQVDKLGDVVLTSNVYHESVGFPISLRLQKNVKQVQLQVHFSLCNDVCIPKSEILTVQIPEGAYKNKETLDIIKYWRSK